jgi:uncharacterized protein YraI
MISAKTTVSAVALLLASAGAASAFVATATTDLNVRRGPGTNHGVVDVLQAGEAVEVVNRAGGWYQLSSGGWASGNYLDAQGGGQTVVIDRGGYGYGGGYGPAAFYYDDSPYYWDPGGYYWFWANGVRRRVAYDWWQNHRGDIRWDNRWRYRDWDGPGRDRRVDRRDDRQDRRVDRRDNRQDQRVDRRDFREGQRADRQDFRQGQLREGRASAAGGPQQRWYPEGGGRMSGRDFGGGRMGGGNLGGARGGGRR